MTKLYIMNYKTLFNNRQFCHITLSGIVMITLLIIGLIEKKWSDFYMKYNEIVLENFIISLYCYSVIRFVIFHN